MLDDEMYQKISELVKDKTVEWYDKVKGLTLADLKVNVFLAASMEMTDAKELINFFGMRAIERSLGTSFGFLIQKIAEIVSGGARITHEQGGDLRFLKDGEEWRIEIESGPACANKKMMESTSRSQLAVKEKDPAINVGLGLTYGKPEDLFPVMRDYYKGDQILIGKEFWEHLTGDGDAYKKILGSVKKGVEGAKREAEAQRTLIGGKEERPPLSRLIKEKLDELTREWIDKYGESLDYGGIIKSYF